jgi:hypothetical protein
METHRYRSNYKTKQTANPETRIESNHVRHRHMFSESALCSPTAFFHCADLDHIQDHIQDHITYFSLFTYLSYRVTDNRTSPNRDEAPRRAGFGGSELQGVRVGTGADARSPTCSLRLACAAAAAAAALDNINDNDDQRKA